MADEKHIIEVGEGDKVWIGDASTILLQMVSDVINLISALSQTIATHDQPNVAPITQASSFVQHSADANALNASTSAHGRKTIVIEYC